MPPKKRRRRYVVLIESGPRNLSAWVPDLPGCVAVAKTRRGMVKLIREAIAFHIEGMERDGDPIPEPTSDCEMVEV